MPPETPAFQSIPVSNLLFDPENPRLPDSVDGTDDQAVLDWMLSDAGLVELMGSIAMKGFFPAEPLLVMEAIEQPGSYWVLEGNRRLAAVMLLLEPGRAPRRRNAVLDVSSDLQNRASLTHLPCAVFSDRSDVLDYLGYRHITGIKQWEPSAKARYLDSLYREHLGSSGPDVYRYIARLIGSRSDYVMRLLGALRLFESVAQDEQSVLDAEDISFSLITLALNYAAVVEFLGLETLEQESFREVDRSRLAELAEWLFDERSGLGRTQLGESRNMKFLAAAVRHPEGLAALRSGETVEEAASATVDIEDLLVRALRTARERLTSAQNLLHRAQYADEALQILEDVEELADQIRILLQRKQRAARRADV